MRAQISSGASNTVSLPWTLDARLVSLRILDEEALLSISVDDPEAKAKP
jgi:hypothetical protein